MDGHEEKFPDTWGRATYYRLRSCARSSHSSLRVLKNARGMNTINSVCCYLVFTKDRQSTISNGRTERMETLDQRSTSAPQVRLPSPADMQIADLQRRKKTLQREILKKRFCGVNAIDSQIRSESFCACADRQHSVQCYLLVLITAPYQGARQVKILRHAPSLFVCFKQVSDETSILWSLEGEAAFLSRPAGPEA